MSFRFKAATSAGGAKGLARQASRRLSLLTPHNGGLPAPITTAVAAAESTAAARSGVNRPSSARRRAAPPSSRSASSTATLTTRAGTLGPDAAATGLRPGAGERGLAAPGTVTAIDYHDYRAAGQPGAASLLRGNGKGRRGLATMVEKEGGEVASAGGGSGMEGIVRTSASVSLEASGHAGGGSTAPLVLPREDVDRLLQTEEGKGGREIAGTQGASVETEDGPGNGGGVDAGDDGTVTVAAKTKEGAGGGISGSRRSSSFLSKCNKDLKVYARAGEADKAIAMLARMREAGVTPTSRSYTSAINACKNGVSAQWEEALALLKEAGTDGSGVVLNAFHYTATMKACGGANRWDEVRLLKSEMETQRIVPGLPYYHWAIKGAATRKRRGGDGGGDSDAAPPAAAAAATRGWEAVRGLAEEMSRKGVVPNQNSYRLIDQVKTRLSTDGRAGDEGEEEAGRVVALLRGIEGAPEPLPLPPPGAKKKREGVAGAASAESPEGQTETSNDSTTKNKKNKRKQQQQQQQSGGTNGSVPDGGGASTKTRAPSASGKGGAGKGLGSVAACNKTLRQMSGTGEGTKAATLIASMREAGLAPTDKSFTSAMNACRQRAQWREVLRLLKSACSDPGVTVNEFHYAAAVKTCAKANQWDRIPALLADMESRGISAGTDLYNWAIKSASSAKIGGPARSILAREGGWKGAAPAPPDGASSSDGDAADITADTTSDDGDSSHRNGIADSAGADTRGDTPDNRSSRSRSGTASPPTGWEAATGLLRHMLDRGVPPNAITYTLVLSACRGDREPERALSVLRDMQARVAAAAAEKEEEHEDGREEEEKEEGGPSAPEEGEAEGGLEGGDWADANSSASSSSSSASSSELWRRRRERRVAAITPNVIHYASVMSAFTEHPGGWKTNLALMKEMEEAGIAHNVYTYNAAITACGWEGRWAEAVAVFRRMSKKGVSPDEVSFLKTIGACGKGDQWALAIALLREMSTPPPDASSTAATEKGGPADGATAAWTVNPTVEAYAAAITACGNAGQWEVAVGLLREVADGDVMVVRHGAPRGADDGGGGDGGGTPADGEEEDEAEGSAAAAEQEHESSASSSSSSSTSSPRPVPVPLAPDVILYNATIEACGKSGQWERAVQVLAEIWEAGLSPTVVTYNSAIACCGAADKWEKAVALLDEMRLVGLTPVSSTFLPAIEACTRAGEGKVAYALIKERDATQRRMKRHPNFATMKRSQRQQQRQQQLQQHQQHS